MAGVPHRSLGRKIDERFFRGCNIWRAVADIPQDALDDIAGRDPETSLWDDGENGEHLNDVLLSLLLAKPSIGPFALALLWQDDERIGPDLGARIIQSDGETPYEAGRRLHYHVSDPTDSDYPRLALAVAARDDVRAFTRDQVRDIIEDAHVAGILSKVEVNERLDKAIKKLIEQRFVSAKALNAEGRRSVFDVRPADRIRTKIANATFTTEAQILDALHDAKISKESPFTLYCDDGQESRRIARIVRATERRPRILVGGFAEWTRLDFAVETC